MRTMNMNSTRSSAAITAAFLITAGASAQAWVIEPEEPVAAEIARSVESARAPDAPEAPRVPVIGMSGHTGTSVFQNSDGTEVKVEQKNGEVWVYRDGEEIFHSEADAEWNEQTVTDEKGEPVVRLFRSDGGPHSLVIMGPGEDGEFSFDADSPMARRFGWPGRDAGPFGAARVEVDVEMPKVMMGITMGEPDEAVAAQLGIHKGEATQITGVIEGLPASEAGLRKHDVVTSIDGKSPAAPESIREALKAKEPGDTLELGIIRAGQPLTVTLTLEEYDPEKLGGFGGAVAPEARARVWNLLGGGEQRELRERIEEAREALEALRERRREAAGQREEQRLQRQMERQQERIAELSARLEAMQGLRFPDLRGRGSFFFEQEPGGALIVPAPEPPDVPVFESERIKELIEQVQRLRESQHQREAELESQLRRLREGGELDEMEERFEKIESTLADLQEMMRRLVERQEREGGNQQ